VPINAAKDVDAGTYEFAIDPSGVNLQVGDDYEGWCELTITAYTGQGTSTDFVSLIAGSKTDEAHADR
jgi:hypothetical protein